MLLSPLRIIYRNRLKQQPKILLKQQQSFNYSNMANRAAFITSAKGPFEIRDYEKSEPGEGEILIKV